MRHKSLGKRMASCVLTSAMLVSTAMTAMSAMTLTASAGGEMLETTNFDDGVGLPWHTSVTPPAKLNVEIKDGTYNITIVERGGAEVGGEDRWDCQFRYRKLQFHSGSSYTVKATVTADHDGEIYTRIGDYNGDIEIWHNGYGSNDAEFIDNWKCMPVKANEPLMIDSTWTCKVNLDQAEWTWHFGGAGTYQNTPCFENGTTLSFDNMSCYNNTEDIIEVDPKEPLKPFRGNQCGYYPTLEKKATFCADKAFKDRAVYIVDAESKKVVWEGNCSSGIKPDADSGIYCGVFDFSDLTQEGTYFFSTDGQQAESFEFRIGNDIYGNVVKDALNYFYQNRCGMNIEEKYITSTGENDSKKSLTRSDGHSPDTGYIQSLWVKSYMNDNSDVVKDAGSVTATGGWHDSGTYSKSIPEGGVAVWTLQNLYEWTQKEDKISKADKFANGSNSIQVPEADNQYPDLLDEARYELEYFFSMMADGNYKMESISPNAQKDDTGKYENMVYQQICDSQWTALALKPWDYIDDWQTVRIVKPPTTEATLAVSACAAQAARLWKDYDPAFADLCLKNAKLTYEAAKANPYLNKPADAVYTNISSKEQSLDDFYWAACELYITTGDKYYLADVESSEYFAYKLTTSLNGGDNNGSFTSFSTGNTSGYGTLSLFLNPDAAGEHFSDVVDSIRDAADAYRGAELEQGFGIPYKSATFEDALNIGPGITINGYENGSNAIVVNNSMVMAYAYSATGDEKYLNGVAEGMDYLFGRNAMDNVYVTGYGTRHTINPHHNFWSHELDPEYPYAPSGVMVGGPNSGLQDPYMVMAGLNREDDNPPQVCYVDSVEAWSVNDVALQWNAPFAWVMSFLEDATGNAPTPSVTTATTTDKTTTTTTTTTTTSAVTDTSVSESKASTTTTKEAVQKTVYGDIDCDDDVNIRDVILICRYVNEDLEVKDSITEQGAVNANCYNPDDDALNADDITAVVEFIAKLVTLPIKK